VDADRLPLFSFHSSPMWSRRSATGIYGRHRVAAPGSSLQFLFGV
jgi:hypothetical protein